MSTAYVKRIGTVRNSVTEPVDEGWGDVESSIELLPAFRPGLKSLDQFSHAIIVTYLHLSAFDPERHLIRRPRHRKDMPEVGIFAQRAKDRPNPLGITAVEIVSCDNGILLVRGLDAIDGTPVLDIKPYYPEYDHVASARVPEWEARLMDNYF